jgi:hypothetical protein
MSKTFFAKYLNKLCGLYVSVIVCLLMLTIYVWTNAKSAGERLVRQQFNLSLVNLSQNIDARILDIKLIVKRNTNNKYN